MSSLGPGDNSGEAIFGYETATMRAALGMIFANELPATLPPGPRARREGEPDSPIKMWGGTLNHWKIALFTRILWLRLTGQDPELLRRHVEAAIAVYRFELEKAWECRGKQCEQGSPSHGQQNESPAWGLLYVAHRFDLRDLAAPVFAWLGASLAASDVFAPPVPWERQDGSPSPVPGLLVVGARAFTDRDTLDGIADEDGMDDVTDQDGPDDGTDRDELSGVLIGGRCFVRDALYRWQRVGVQPALGNPLAEIDLAALHLGSRIERDFLPDLRQRLNAAPRTVPPLRFPVEVWTEPGGGRAYRLSGAQALEGAQHLAGIVGGRKFFAFTPGAPLPAGPSWRRRRLVTGEPIHV